MDSAIDCLNHLDLTAEDGTTLIRLAEDPRLSATRRARIIALLTDVHDACAISYRRFVNIFESDSDQLIRSSSLKAAMTLPSW